MPIKPENKHLYPANWKALSFKIRKEAGWRCENCQRAHRLHYRDASGQLRQVILTVAHLDQNPQNNHPSNLKALCQRCHFAHDRPFNLAKRALRRRPETLERRDIYG